MCVVGVRGHGFRGPFNNCFCFRFINSSPGQFYLLKMYFVCLFGGGQIYKRRR